MFCLQYACSFPVLLRRAVILRRDSADRWGFTLNSAYCPPFCFKTHQVISGTNIRMSSWHQLHPFPRPVTVPLHPDNHGRWGKDSFLKIQWSPPAACARSRTRGAQTRFAGSLHRCCSCMRRRLQPSVQRTLPRSREPSLSTRSFRSLKGTAEHLCYACEDGQPWSAGALRLALGHLIVKVWF